MPRLHGIKTWPTLAQTMGKRRGRKRMKTYYQVYRASYWYTSTDSLAEAEQIAYELEKKGYDTEIKTGGMTLKRKEVIKSENGN